MLKTAISHIWKITKITLSYCFLVLLLHSCISSYIGYNGYKKWERRRSTFGNRATAIKRQVFIKDLEYSSSIKLDSFNIFIEKGYKYGFKTSEDTRLVTGSKYPYQVSYTSIIGFNDIHCYIVKNQQLDSANTMEVFLDRAYLKDTIIIGINKYTTKWDSIGYIKVWDADKE